MGAGLDLVMPSHAVESHGARRMAVAPSEGPSLERRLAVDMTPRDPTPAASGTSPASPAGSDRAGSDPSDQALVEAVARGDSECLALLYDRYVGLLLAIARRMLRDDAQAEDVVQESFVRLWRDAHTYDPSRGTVRTWLSMRLRSRTINHLKSARVRRETSAEVVPEGEERAEQMELYAERGALRRSLAELSPAQREVLELAYFRGLSCAEIAARAQVPLGTVKSRLAGGLKKLKLALREEPRSS